MIVIGLMNCGKMHWINRLLENDMFTQPVSSILYCYSIYQQFFDKMHNNPNILCPIIFHNGLPSVEDINVIDDGGFHLIVLHDLMETIVQSKDMRDLFTMYCHHKNITVVMVSQNTF